MEDKQPQASLVSSDRVNYTILEEKSMSIRFRLCPLLAVWTVSGHPLGTLDPVGMLWRRGCAQEPQDLEKALRTWCAIGGQTRVTPCWLTTTNGRPGDHRGKHGHYLCRANENPARAHAVRLGYPLSLLNSLSILQMFWTCFKITRL